MFNILLYSQRYLAHSLFDLHIMAAPIAHMISSSSDEEMRDNVSLPSVCDDVILAQSDSEGSVGLPSEVEDDNDWESYMAARQLCMDCDEIIEPASETTVAMGREPGQIFAEFFLGPEWYL